MRNCRTSFEKSNLHVKNLKLHDNSQKTYRASRFLRSKLSYNYRIIVHLAALIQESKPGVPAP